VSRAQRSTSRAFTPAFAGYGDALQTRDRYELRVSDGPGSAAPYKRAYGPALTRSTLHRVRDTQHHAPLDAPIFCSVPRRSRAMLARCMTHNSTLSSANSTASG
jgi:hypothetical protein